MEYLIFETPGLIERDAFFLMGANVKVVDNPIGQFGTGLKYSVACLARWGDPMTVQIGAHEYTFVATKGKFREVDLTRIMMRRGFRAWVMPYTTEYGRYWQPWMIVRELESNTRDESGRSYVTTEKPLPTPGITRIIVTNRGCLDAYHNLQTIFLPGAASKGEGVQVFETPSEHIYWRGLRVHTLRTPAQRTYNILSDITLTEDRTLYGEWQASEAIARWTIHEADIPQIKAVITAKPETFEGKIDLSVTYKPSEAFHETMALEPKNVRPQVTSYYGYHDPRPRATASYTREWKLEDQHPFPWRVEGDMVVDRRGGKVFERGEGSQSWPQVSHSILRRLNPIEKDVIL